MTTKRKKYWAAYCDGRIITIDHWGYGMPAIYTRRKDARSVSQVVGPVEIKEITDAVIAGAKDKE